MARQYSRMIRKAVAEVAGKFDAISQLVFRLSPLQGSDFAPSDIAMNT